MDKDILKMEAVLSLTEGEPEAIVMSHSTWQSSNANHHLTLVGTLLSHKPVNFEALRNTLLNLIRLMRGITISKIQENRFYFVFNHVVDLKRTLDLRPWTFDRNLLIIQPLLPELLIRIRVNIFTTAPIKREIKLRSELEDEVLVRFTYERLPNFCYICGKLGHISKFADMHFVDDIADLGSNAPYGPWLRENTNNKSSHPSPVNL
ncbi:UNVERIFIED_CONTAM: hypothetical protein Slati_2367600 [Sesamum latifolium]|uniref:DUF4283 domain-containing protein n=1 Tax=Sesamum latifolium TaxID=2727402 RepID=A0AAW2WC36_9LAMI